MDDKEKLLTIQQASSLLGLNAGTLRHWAQENKVRAFKVGTRGDWRFKKEDLQEIIKKHGEENYHIVNKYSLISNFLISNANSIQKHATYLHKKFLGGEKFRTEYINKYQEDHIKIIKEIANNLQNKNISKGTRFFNKFGEEFGKEAIKDGLTIEETVDGIIFLKQAVWDKLKKKGLLKKFTALEMFDINQVVGTYCDVVASRIAFTYHEYFKHDAHKAKEKLVVSERRYRTMIEQSPLSVQIMSAEGKTLIVNKAWEDLWGAKLEQLKNYNMLKDKQLVDLGIMPYIKKGFKGMPVLIPAVKYEPNKSVKDASKILYRWVRAFIYPVKDESGRILEVVLVHEDITEQIKSKEALRESEERFRALTNASSDVVYRMSPDWKEMRQLDGRNFLADTGKPDSKWLQKYIHPDDQRRVLEVIDEAIRTQNVFELEHRVKRVDGTLGWTFSRAIPILDQKGEIIEWFGAAIDITEHKRAERELKESEERFRALADNIPNLAWMARADGYIFWYNCRWYEYTGTSQKDMEGWGWQSVHDPKILSKVLEEWNKSIDQGITFEMVFPIRGVDGEFRPFLTRVVPIRDSGNRIVRWFGTNTDITKQIELEKQKDEFLGIASHELKTPVTSIKAYTQVLERLFQRNGDIKSAEMLAKMGVQIDKLSSLIEDLLDVTKIRSGKIIFHEEFFDFNELAQQIVEELQLTTDRHEIVKEFAATRTIFGDRDRIGQVISNLISNAIKYSPKARRIIVKTEVNHDNITLCVQDFGIGIPKEKQGKVFEQFFRVSGEREITFPGLGLGLYVSSQIIKREGGKIWVNSIRGKGSSFYFSLPLSKGK
jgi:PAS domain S-box-containing protein/excisionase family DNA binding protein